VNSLAWPEAAAYGLVMWFVVRPLGVAWGRAADARGVLDPAQQGRLTRAFQAFGPERVARGVTARGHSWRDCFVALAAFDEPRALDPAIRHCWWVRGSQVFSARLGTTPTVIKDVAQAWDGHEAAFRALAAAWLEQRAMAPPRAVRQLAAEQRSCG
jgi:hypothetical protein